MRDLLLRVLGLMLAGMPVTAAAAGSVNGSADRLLVLREISLCYRLAFGGVPFGNLVFNHASGGIADKDGYRADLLVETFPPFSRFAPFRYAAVTGGRMAGPARPAPESYLAFDGPRQRGRRRIELRFDARTGGIRSRIWPPRDASTVAPELRIGALDPLSAVILARGEIWRRLANGGPRPGEPIRVPVFDGRQRYDLEFRIKGRTTRYRRGWDRPVVHAQAWLVPIAGFKERHLDQLPDEPIEIYFSADAEFVPLYIETGWKSMRLVKRANDGRRCDG